MCLNVICVGLDCVCGLILLRYVDVLSWVFCGLFVGYFVVDG